MTTIIGVWVLISVAGYQRPAAPIATYDSLKDCQTVVEYLKPSGNFYTCIKGRRA